MSESMMVWNVNKGGYEDYKAGPKDPPTRFEDILTFLHEQRENNNVKDFILTDTYLWDRYGDSDPKTGENPGLAASLGMRAAFHTRLEDAYLEKKGREGVGITFATNHDVISSRVITTGTEGRSRKALLVNLDIGGKELAVGGIYLPETDPQAQHAQLTDLEAEVNPNVSLNPIPEDAPIPPRNIIMAGDFNTQGLPKKSDPLSKKVLDLVMHGAAMTMQGLQDKDGQWGYRAKVLNTLTRRQLAARMVKGYKYEDIDAGPTYPAYRPLFRIDHAFVKGEDIAVTNARVQFAEELSDHGALIFDYDMSGK